MNRFVIDSLKRPTVRAGSCSALDQLARLSYMGLFSIPVLAPLARARLRRRWLRRPLTLRDGIPADQCTTPRPTDRCGQQPEGVPRQLLRGRCVGPDRPLRRRAGPAHRQLTRTAFVRPYVYDDTQNWVPRLWRRDVKAGHWAPMSHPPMIARSVHEFVDHLAGKPPSRALLRAQVGRPREYFGDTLVSVTGAGSGIGRETALAFAREGAEVVISDIDEASVKDTAAQITARGGVAHAYTLDVADADAVERFAEQVCTEHGVPDIVVNNAGVGQAGAFLDTPREEYDRVLDINFGGVVNGCRSFASRMVDRGTGGHIVNVASMAAYSPVQSMNAYAPARRRCTCSPIAYGQSWIRPGSG